MKFRAIIRTDDAGMAANVGGAVLTEYVTVEFEAPALVATLTLRPNQTYLQTQIVGVEIIPTDIKAAIQDGVKNADD